jgi:hypothetical protein
VTSRLGPGKIAKLFLQCNTTKLTKRYRIGSREKLNKYLEENTSRNAMVTDSRRKMIITIETFVCLKTTAVLFQAFITEKSGDTIPLNQKKLEDA